MISSTKGKLRGFTAEGHYPVALIRTVEGPNGPIEVVPVVEITIEPIGIGAYTEFLDRLSAASRAAGNDEQKASAEMFRLQRELMAERIRKWNGPAEISAETVGAVNPLVFAKIWRILIGNDAPDEWLS